MARFVTNVTVISPDFTDEIKKLPYTFIEKEYEKSDLESFFLVYVCTGNHELNARIKVDAEELGILTSVCDARLCCAILYHRQFIKKSTLLLLLERNGRNATYLVDIRKSNYETVSRRNNSFVGEELCSPINAV